ncbi:Hypothetical protein CINCED_3A008237 [Cinara cedri]|uniref:Uncharacterized protein n=1 Tax=Cinara cedri TaxID=506608 RepID=A0A5E4NIU9_9HEMI|nr:Hypothetical protein CINCED_3A008237 [Cinara cedri]
MSVLMFVDAAGDGRWPSAYSVNRFRSKSATDVQSEGHRPTTVFAYRQPESLLVDAVAREFALSTCRGHRIRVVLIGVQDPQLAELLYQERGLPVNVVFSTPEVDDRWFGVLGPLPGITMSAWQGWRPTMLGDDDKNDDEDVVSLVVDVINTLCDDYRSYMVGLRDVPSFATHLDASSSVDNGSVYATIMDTFGEGVQAVEPVLDAMLEQLCGATEQIVNSGSLFPSSSSDSEEIDKISVE